MSKEPEETGASRELPERWSVQQKTDVVLRLLRGEDLGELSREIQVPAHEIEEWRRVFIESGSAGLKRRGGDPAERELVRTRAKLGETMMKLELTQRGPARKKGVRGGIEEAQEVAGMKSVFTGRVYPRTMICAVYRLPRSTWYAAGGLLVGERPMAPIKRGPRSRWSDKEVLSSIREVLLESSFHGEGYRKVRVKLRARGIWVGRNRVLRIMREKQLLVPVRRLANHGDRSHEGRIQTDRPNELWGADAARFYTQKDGWCWFFGAIDHCSEDIVGWHVAKRGDRWAALEPIRQGGSELITGITRQRSRWG